MGYLKHYPNLEELYRAFSIIVLVRKYLGLSLKICWTTATNMGLAKAGPTNKGWTNYLYWTTECGPRRQEPGFPAFANPRNVSTIFMMTALRYIKIIFLTIFLFERTFAQDSTATADFYAQIKNYDLSTILMADNFLAEDVEDGKEKIKRA